jgi:DNA topoisomerase IA
MVRFQWLILWLDCDREGENIAVEVRNACLEKNPRLVVFRAKFSALIPQEIERSSESPLFGSNGVHLLLILGAYSLEPGVCG